MDARRLISELKSRGVYRVAAIYCAGAWALLQVADVLFPVFGLPEAAVSVVLLAGAVGFPVALLLSWCFDIVPGTSSKTASGVDDAHVAPRRTATAAQIIELTLMVLLSCSVAYLYIDRLSDAGADNQQRLPPVPDGVNQRPSIAVMPFINLAETADTDYFGDGLAEEILNLLARLSELDVAARTSSFYFKNKDADVRAIAARLGVGHVLEGSVRRQGDTLRITAKLVDASSGFQVWSQSYDRELADILAVQEEIATKVVASLQVMLSNKSQGALAAGTQINPQDYDYYLRGRDYLRQPRDEQSLERATALFSKAVSSSPDFADAHAGLCDSLLLNYEIQHQPEQFQRAERSCQHALSLSGESVTVYVALGNLYRSSGQYQQAQARFGQALELNPAAVEAFLGLAATYEATAQLALAEQAYQRAIEIQPNYWRAYTRLGNFLLQVGRPVEALPVFQRIAVLMPESNVAYRGLGAAYFFSGQFEQAERAWRQSLAVAPSALAYSNLGVSLYFLQRFEEAAQMYQHALDLAPEDFESWGNLADAYRQSNTLATKADATYRKAIALAQRSLEINPVDASTLALLAHYQAAIGQRESASNHLRRAFELAPEDMYVNYTSATALCALGETEAALAALERALAAGYPWQLVAVDTGLASLRGLPQYEAMGARAR